MPAAAVIGDIVRSKRSVERSQLQRDLVRALDAVNRQIPAIQPFDVTIGDEFQGVLRTVEDAVLASLLIRLQLLPRVDARFGIGWGAYEVFEPARRPLSQDGPAWWSAREAIEIVAQRQKSRGHARGLRTMFIDSSAGPWTHPGGERPQYERAMNAFLLCRDELVGIRATKTPEVFLGWLLGQSQTEIASTVGIGQSAVSQQLSRAGAFAVRDAHEILDRSSPWKS